MKLLLSGCTRGIPAEGFISSSKDSHSFLKTNLNDILKQDEVLTPKDITYSSGSFDCGGARSLYDCGSSKKPLKQDDLTLAVRRFNTWGRK